MDINDIFSVNRSSRRLNESLAKTFGQKLNLESFDLDQLQDARNRLRTQLSQHRTNSEFNENIENEHYLKAKWMLDAINAEIAERDENIIESDVEEGAMKDLATDVEDFLVGWQDAAVDHEEYQVQGELVALQKQFNSDGDIDALYNELRKRAAGDEFYKSLAMFFKKQFKNALGKSNEDVEEGQSDVDYELHQIARSDDEEELIDAMEGLKGAELQIALEDMMSELKDELAAKGMNDVMRDEDKMIEMLMDKVIEEYGEDGEEYDDGDMDSSDADSDALKSAGFGSDEDYESIQFEKAPGYVSRGVGSLTGAVSGIGGALLGSMFWGLLGPVGVAAGAIGGTVGGYKVGSETADAVWDKVTELLGSDKKATEFGVAHAKAAKAGETSFEFGGKEYDVTLKPQEVGKAVADLKAVKEAYTMEVSPPGFKGTVKAMKKHDEIDNPYALAWHMKKKGYKSHKKADGSDKNESVEQGEDMTTLREGEVQQASAIVTAKTMVDRVGRWIEELSGMENETLLQLGDSIRDEMGQEQAKAFIEQVAPAIQQALETLKGTRETISNGVNTLATGEAPADMLGTEPAEGGEDDMAAPAEPDMMNAEEPTGDEFAAAEPAAGGAEAAGREQRESVSYQNRLLKVLAG
jgi:hypothetical protein